MRRGFTLVELSIVLVIIGLLIGGILVAQSMVETAKIQSMVKQLQQYHVMVLNFQGRYKGGWPGDSPLFNPPGDGNDAGSATETVNFWPHLQQGGMLQSDAVYSNDLTAGLNANMATPNAPKLGVASSNTIAVVVYQLNPAVAKNAVTYLIANFKNCTTTGYGACMTPGLSPAMMGPLDMKIDDGTTGGKMQNVWAADTADCTAVNYDLSNRNLVCKVLFYDVMENR